MIKVSIDRGHWANQLRKLSAALGQTAEETIDAQAKLLVRDCVKATPPFTPGKNFSESLAQQKRVGEQAVQRDLARVFREAGGYKKLTDGRLARRIAKLVSRGDEAKAVEELRISKINVEGIERRPTKALWDKQRNKRGQVPFRKEQGFLVHDGRIPEFLSAPLSAKNKPNDPILAEMLADRIATVGNAKSGWVIAAENLGLKLPRWIKRQKGAAFGIFKRNGSGTKYAVTVGNGVPYIQDTGKELGIIKWAMKNRERNIEKQIRMTLKKKGVTA
jgi:hypothetical protein